MAAIITGEKRFGPNFTNGRDEEPNPHSYAISSDVDALLTQTTSTKGTFGQTSRPFAMKEKKKREVPGPTTYRLPGEFPKTYTTKEIHVQQKEERKWKEMKNGSPLRRNIARPLETLRNEKGPGAYHNLDKDTRQERISIPFSFGKAKRLNIVEFSKMRGQYGCSPGPCAYTPMEKTICRSVYAKHDLKSILAKEQQNDDMIGNALESLELSKSHQLFRNSFQKLEAGVHESSSKNHQRIPVLGGISTPGPGRYTSGTDFKTSKCSNTTTTFGKVQRKDLLSAMQEAGHVPISILGPGEYTPHLQSSLVRSTMNARCGYNNKIKTTKVSKKKNKYEVPEDSRIFSKEERCMEVSPEKMYRALMRHPGYKSHVVKETIAKKKPAKSVAKTKSSAVRGDSNVVSLAQETTRSIATTRPKSAARQVKKKGSIKIVDNLRSKLDKSTIQTSLLRPTTPFDDDDEIKEDLVQSSPSLIHASQD